MVSDGLKVDINNLHFSGGHVYLHRDVKLVSNRRRNKATNYEITKRPRGKVVAQVDDYRLIRKKGKCRVKGTR